MVRVVAAGFRSRVVLRFTLLILVLLFFFLVLTNLGLGNTDDETRSVNLVFFVDKTLLPLFSEVEKNFVPRLEKQYDIDIRIQYVAGSSGFVLAQMNLTGKGDVYGSDDYTFAKQAVASGLVYPESVKVIGYISLAVYLPLDSKLNVTGLKDLILDHRGLRVAIGDPTHVAAGKLLEELLVETGLWDPLLRNHVVVRAASASDVVSLVRTGNVDAGISFDVFYYMNPSGIRLVEIEPEVNVRAAPVVVGMSVYTRHPDIVSALINYMASSDFVKVLGKYGFKTSEEMTREYPHMALPDENDIVN